MNYTVKNKLPNQLSLAPLRDLAGIVIRLLASGHAGDTTEVDEATRNSDVMERVVGLGWVDVTASGVAPAVPHKVPASPPPKAATPSPVIVEAPKTTVVVKEAPVVIKTTAKPAELTNPLSDVVEPAPEMPKKAKKAVDKPTDPEPSKS